MLFNRDLRKAVEQNVGEGELWDLALESGLVTLQVAAVRKLAAGITTADEIIRTVYSVDMEGDVS